MTVSPVAQPVRNLPARWTARAAPVLGPVRGALRNPWLRTVLFVVAGAVIAVLLFELAVTLAQLLDIPVLRDVGNNVDGGTAAPGAAGAGGGAGGAAGGGKGKDGGGKAPKETPEQQRDREMNEEIRRQEKFKKQQDDYLKQHPEAVPDYQTVPEPNVLEKTQKTFWESFWTLGGKSPR